MVGSYKGAITFHVWTVIYLCFEVDMNGPTEFRCIAYTKDHTLVVNL